MSRKDRYDAFLVRIFKYVVVVLALFSFVLFFGSFDHDLTFGYLLYCICCSYTAGFCVIGLFSVMFRRTSLFPRWKMIAVVLALATVIAFVMWELFNNDPESPNVFIAGFMYILVWTVETEPTLVLVIAGVYSIAAIITFATYGVLEVLSALLGKDFHRVILSLMKSEDSKLKRRSRKLFMVPDIIDVDDVTLDPRKSVGFDLALFRHLYKYVLGVGVIVASYLFLNPVFLQLIPIQDMMLIIILLSIFVSVLVVPVNLTRTLGAEARSAGNRPFPLWKGMKTKMFHPGFYILLFLTLLWVCLFTDEDLARIFVSYVGYFIFMILTSMLVSFIYVNSFYPDLNEAVASNFEEAKSKL
ncbi:MAG: hypothetical protein E7Z63_02595 [Thermoplasmata archaeon]|nr:hypothetical protein [Thermoplasmata archaeon]